MEAVNKIMRHLKTTSGKGTMFRKTDRRCIEAYIESNWAGSIIDKNSPLDIVLLCGQSRNLDE